MDLTYRPERAHTCLLRTLAMYTPSSHSRPDPFPFRICIYQYRFTRLIQPVWFGPAAGMIHNTSQAGATPDTRHTCVNSKLTTGVCPTAHPIFLFPCLRLRAIRHYPRRSSTRTRVRTAKNASYMSACDPVAMAAMRTSTRLGGALDISASRSAEWVPGTRE